jgi:hypothetical protein
MDPPPANAEAAAAASVIAPLGKPEKATTKAARPTTLLDVQEVEWITRELERLLAREQSTSSEGVGDAGAAGRHRRKRARLSPAPAAHKGGFLADLLGRHAVYICSGDTVDHSSAAGDRGRRRDGEGVNHR